MADVTTVTPTPHSTPSPRSRPNFGHGPVTRPNMAAVGTMVWLSSELMFFAGLFAIYFSIRAVRPDLWAEETAKLNVPFAAANTMVLVISSIWCQLGVFKAEHGIGSREGTIWQVNKWGMREWYVLTYVFGSVFVAGQVFEYAELWSHGFGLNTNAYTSAFFLTTGFHAIHVIGGLLAFLVIIGRSMTAKNFTHRQATGAIVTSYYWHFVDVVWIALFAAIYLLQ